MPRKPKYIGGVKGHDNNDNSLPGSSPPERGKLHNSPFFEFLQENTVVYERWSEGETAFSRNSGNSRDN